MLKFHIIIIKFSIFTNKNSQSYTFFPNLKNTIVKIDIKSFSVHREFIPTDQTITGAYYLEVLKRLIPRIRRI